MAYAANHLFHWKLLVAVDFVFLKQSQYKFSTTGSTTTK